MSQNSVATEESLLSTEENIGQLSNTKVEPPVTTNVVKTDDVNSVPMEAPSDAPNVFAGEMVKKKLASDFMAKDSFMWVDSINKTVHWSKSAEDKTHNVANSKYVLLKSGLSNSLNIGECKGVVKTMSLSGKSILLQLTSDGLDSTSSKNGAKSLELKMDATKAVGWMKVFKELSS